MKEIRERGELNEHQTSPIRSRKLFICGTPLQSLLIQRIIETEGIEKKDCHLFFYTYNSNPKYERAFRKISHLFDGTHYHFCDNTFPKLAIQAKKIFSDVDYQEVYFASAISNFVFLALSKKDGVKITTFDDGTANISSTSLYASTYGLSIKKALGLALFGNRYSLKRIRKESRVHYTLYPDAKNNISQRTTPISIISPVLDSSTDRSCSLILGTVFESAIPSRPASEVLTSISRFAQQLQGEVFFLPHPRARVREECGVKMIDTDMIAEEVIVDLCSQYKSIDLYGFCSSAQLNLGTSNRIRNHLLTTKGLVTSLKQMQNTLIAAGVIAHGTIDLDTF